MAKISLAKALKEKNSIAGKLKELQGRLNTYNSWVEGTEPAFDATTLMLECMAMSDNLKRLKILIQTKNVGIAFQLVTLAEAKSWITWLKSINTREGVVEEYDRYDRNPKPPITYKVQYNSKYIIKTVEFWENFIVETQDDIDTYNASTFIDFDITQPGQG